MPLGAHPVYPDRDGHAPFRSDCSDRRIARRAFVRRLYGVLHVEHDQVRSCISCLCNRPRVGCRQKQNRPHREEVDASVVFRFRYSHGRRIMPPTGEIGEE